ncbi:MAG: aspartate aminotransferase family protein [Gallionella sp.]|nr:aspartate aminotransferase family protein [Gallionella sp.]
MGGSLISALAADWLTSTWDQNAALYGCSPVASVIEEVAGGWIKELLDLPREASFAFTTGCQLAHFTCLASARASVLEKAGWNVNEGGLCGAPKIRVLTSEHRHGSVDRAVRFLGLGNKSIESIAADRNGRMEPGALQVALHKTQQPTILVLSAGDLNIAAFDPFDEIIPLAKQAGTWVHVDGAFGLFSRASAKFRHLTAGIEQADSWATDAHKWLNVPFDCGMAIVRDRAAHREAMTISASYIAADSNARDQIDWNPEWSRRARGIPVYAALRELGREGVADLIERTSRHCLRLVTEIGRLPGAQMLWEPRLNQGLVRFLDQRPGASDGDHDSRTERIVAAVNADGEAFFSTTTWRGERAMRVSVVNWRTSERDVERAIRAVKRALGGPDSGSEIAEAD